MKKIVMLLGMFFIYSLLSARTITIINNTGLTLRAAIHFSGCSAINRDIPNANTIEASEAEIDIGDCCFTDVALTIIDGKYKGESVRAYGDRNYREFQSCQDATFIVEIKDEKLIWFRK